MDSHRAALDELRQTLLEERTGPLVYVVGGVDAGKTTLAREVAGALASRWPTAVVDADPGQSSLALPTCLAAGWTGGEAPFARRFVGDVTPSGHMLQTLTGVVRLVRRAREEGAEAVVVDSSGYVGSVPAWAFQHQTIDALEPGHLVGLCFGGELEPVLAPFRKRRGVTTHRLPPSPRVRPRDREERWRYREERLASYFHGAVERSFDLEAVPLHGRLPPPGAPEEALDRLAAALDPDGFVLELGVVKRLEPGASVELLAPPLDPERVAGIELGSRRWTPPDASAPDSG